MSKKNQNIVSDKTIKEAAALAKATTRPGQTKEQTKLIAQGIQKGIAEYKKQQKVKARELDKKLKKAKKTQPHTALDEKTINKPTISQAKSWSVILPWILLGLSWLYFFIFVIYNK